MREMLYKVNVTVVGKTHAGSPDADIFEVAVPVCNNGADILRTGMRLQRMLYIFKPDSVQFAILKHLDIVQAFLLSGKAFKEYDHMIFFHKPGGHFPLIPVIITPY